LSRGSRKRKRGKRRGEKAGGGGLGGKKYEENFPVQGISRRGRKKEVRGPKRKPERRGKNKRRVDKILGMVFRVDLPKRRGEGDLVCRSQEGKGTSDGQER